MAYCRAHSKLDPVGELNCDLDEGHEVAHPLHFDKLNNKLWMEAQKEPKPVMYTPTGPLPRLREQLPV